MPELVAGLFTDSKQAGEAVAELKQLGFTEDISVVAKDEDTDEISSYQIKEDITDGTVSGSIVGAVIGATVGIATVLAPGVGTVAVAGPLTAALIGGGAVGAVTGGLVGALVDAGIPDKKAEHFAKRVAAGDVLVTVSVENEDTVERVQRVLDRYSVSGTDARHTGMF